MLLKPNVLLLDEPTNHLDLESIRSLTESLEKYEGTCVFITHDRQMVRQVATRILELSPNGIRELSPQQFTEGQFLEQHKSYQKKSCISQFLNYFIYFSYFPYPGALPILPRAGGLGVSL